MCHGFDSFINIFISIEFCSLLLFFDRQFEIFIHTRTCTHSEKVYYSIWAQATERNEWMQMQMGQSGNKNATTTATAAANQSNFTIIKFRFIFPPFCRMCVCVWEFVSSSSSLYWGLFYCVSHFTIYLFNFFCFHMNLFCCSCCYSSSVVHFQFILFRFIRLIRQLS